jgi:hypothetical protein
MFLYSWQCVRSSATFCTIRTLYFFVLENKFWTMKWISHFWMDCFINWLFTKASGCCIEGSTAQIASSPDSSDSPSRQVTALIQPRYVMVTELPQHSESSGGPVVDRRSSRQERGLGLVVHFPSGYVAKINIPWLLPWPWSWPWLWPWSWPWPWPWAVI